MREILSAFLILLFSVTTVLATENQSFKDVKWVYPEEDKQKEKDAKLTFESEKILLTHEDGAKKGTYAEIPISGISKIVYEKSSHPRWKTAVFLTPWALFSKGKKHWLTIQYQKPDGKEDFVMMHMDKENYQMIIATIESRTGKTVEKMIED